MPSRVITRSSLRAISEVAIVRILGRVPRKLRRSAGRLYASEAYRHLNGLPMLKPNSRANQTVIDWVSREYKRYKESQVVSGLDAKASSTDNVGSPASGPGAGDPEVSFITPLPDEANGGAV